MNECEHLLTVLIEECAEVAERACKALRFGLAETQPGQPDDNRRRLERELADLVATAELLTFTIREEDKAAKVMKLKKYMQYSRELGTLQAPAGSADRLNLEVRELQGEKERRESTEKALDTAINEHLACEKQLKGDRSTLVQLISELWEHAFNQTLTDTSRVIRIQGALNREDSLKRKAEPKKETI